MTLSAKRIAIKSHIETLPHDWRMAGCKSVNGWDRWDAIDDLDYTYLQPQSHRDRYDEGMAKFFGFETVEDLRPGPTE